MDKHIYDFGSLFKGVSKEEKSRIRACESVCEVRKGDVIYREGDRPQVMNCLVRGRVKIFKEGLDRKQIVRFVKPGDFFGYRPYFIKERYTLTAAAMTDCVLISLPLKELADIVENDGLLAMNMVRDLSMRLGSIDARVVSLTQKHTRGRLAEALINLMNTYGRDLNSGMLNCVVSREEIANYANMTTANAIKTLAAFAEEGVIELHGKGICILNEFQLNKICAMG